MDRLLPRITGAPPLGHLTGGEVFFAVGRRHPSGHHDRSGAFGAYLNSVPASVIKGFVMPGIGERPPEDPVPGQLFWSKEDGQLYIWNGEAWVAASCCDNGNALGLRPPVEPARGELWWNSEDGQLYVWNGRAWVAASCCTSAAMLGLRPPKDPSRGMLWWSRGDGQLYVWTGRQWVAASCCTLPIMPPGTVLGNAGPGPAEAHPLDREELTSLINLFTTALPGLVPPPDGSPGDWYLAADGSWKEPEALPPLPNNTVLGNVSGITAPPSPLNQSQLTALISPFTATVSGAVPAPGTVIGYGPHGYFLTSDAADPWQVPGTILNGPTSSSRTIGVYEDWSLFDTWSGTIEITLPDPANIPLGKTITIIIGNNISPNETIDLMASGGAVIYFMGVGGWKLAGAFLGFPDPLPSGIQFQCLNHPGVPGPAWFLVNQGVPVTTISNAGTQVFVGATTAHRAPTVQRFASGAGTYNPPASVTWIRVRMTGGGGGGGGGNYASAGGNSTFGDWVANGGGGGHPQFGSGGQGGPGGDGGANGTGRLVYRVRGGQGAWGFTNQVTGATGVLANRAPGAASIWGGFTCPGSGGNGGPAVDPSSQGSGGGGAGETVEVIIDSPGSITWEVGAGGAASAAGYGVGPGEDGWAGIIVVEEHY